MPLSESSVCIMTFGVVNNKMNGFEAISHLSLRQFLRFVIRHIASLQWKFFRCRIWLILAIGLDKHKFLSVKSWIFSYPSVLTYILGAQKNCLIETVLLSTHNICFGSETRKLIFDCVLLSRVQLAQCFVILEINFRMHLLCRLGNALAQGRGSLQLGSSFAIE